MLNSIKSLIKINNNSPFVLESELISLNLSELELKKNLILLRRNNIKIKHDTNKEINGNIGVSEYLEMIILDETFPPKFATIKYDNANIAHYDFSNLEEFLERSFIQNNLNKKRNLEDEYFYINLIDITKLYINYEELKFIFKYLEEREIIVRGNSRIIESEFSNYYYADRRNKKFKREAVSNTEEQVLLLNKYYKTKDINIRNKLILSNIRLVDYTLEILKNKYNIDTEEYFSYGCEGLITAIEKFDPNLGIKFSTYAFNTIRFSIYKGIKKSYFNFSYSPEFLYAKKLIEEEFNMNLEEDYGLIDKVIDLMYASYNISEITRQRCLKKINSFFNCNIESCILDDSLIDSRELYYNIDLDILIKKLSVFLDHLTDRQKSMIVLRYGLDGNGYKRIREIADIMDCSYQHVSSELKKVLKKLKNYIDNDLYYRDVFVYGDKDKSLSV